DDDPRRGLPTCHKKFGEALAILAGDALLTLAFRVLAGSYNPRVAAVSCAELAAGAGAAGMVGGQVLDLEAEGRIGASGGRESAGSNSGLTSAARLEAIHRAKTGALFRASLRLGVFAAQAERPSGPDPGALAAIHSPADLHGLTDDQLDRLAQEIRDELVQVLTARPAHFASNLGVVELCLALHLTFDFGTDRLIWDTGHQIYPHKLITGRYDRF